MTCILALGLTLRAPIKNELVPEKTDGTGNEPT
jgi:hypothetical protein